MTNTPEGPIANRGLSSSPAWHWPSTAGCGSSVRAFSPCKADPGRLFSASACSLKGWTAAPASRHEQPGSIKGLSPVRDRLLQFLAEWAH